MSSWMNSRHYWVLEGNPGSTLFIVRCVDRFMFWPLVTSSAAILLLLLILPILNVFLDGAWWAHACLKLFHMTALMNEHFISRIWRFIYLVSSLLVSQNQYHFINSILPLTVFFLTVWLFWSSSIWFGWDAPGLGSSAPSEQTQKNSQAEPCKRSRMKVKMLCCVTTWMVSLWILYPI
jgi:hypothetical protein